MGLVKMLRSQLSGCSVLSENEYLSRQDAVFERSDLPGDETIIIEFGGFSEKDRIFLQKKQDTIVLPIAWREDDRIGHILSILHNEGYYTTFEPVLKNQKGDYMYQN